MKAGSKRQLLNQTTNFFWTILCFSPVVIYWYSPGRLNMLYAFTGLSLLAGLLPERMFKSFQLSGSSAFYERIGIRFIRRFVQDGDVINRVLRRGSSGHKVIRDKAYLLKYLKTISMYERYHAVCFILFSLTLLHGIMTRNFLLAGMIMLSNFLYNICPILLQQFNKIRIARLTGKAEPQQGK